MYANPHQRPPDVDLIKTYDAALVLETLRGPDPEDGYSRNPPAGFGCFGKNSVQNEIMQNRTVVSLICSCYGDCKLHIFQLIHTNVDGIG